MNESEKSNPSPAKTWCDQIADLMATVEPEIDESFGPFNLTDDTKPFIANAVLELLRAGLPESKLDKNMTFTPHRIGAAVGHKWAFIRDFGREVRPSQQMPKKIPPALEQLVQEITAAVRELEGVADEMREEIKRAVAASILIALDQEQCETRQFLEGFIKALNTGTITKAGKSVASNPTTQLCNIVLEIGPDLESRFRSVKEFHTYVTKARGQNIAGTLERFQKFCNRFQISFGKPGRPKKKSRTAK